MRLPAKGSRLRKDMPTTCGRKDSKRLTRPGQGKGSRFKSTPLTSCRAQRTAARRARPRGNTVSPPSGVEMAWTSRIRMTSFLIKQDQPHILHIALRVGNRMEGETGVASCFINVHARGLHGRPRLFRETASAVRWAGGANRAGTGSKGKGFGVARQEDNPFQSQQLLVKKR